MVSEWRSCLLGDIIELKRGYDLPLQNRIPGTIPIVSSSGLTGNHQKAMVNGPGVVTGRYGTIGQVFLVEEDFWPLNTTLYVKDFKGNDPRFVSYFLRSIDYRAFSDKAAVPGVNRNHLHEAPIVFPPDIDEQRAIAHVLGTLDDKFELNRKMNEMLEAMARALFKSWFVDFDPVRAKAEGRDPGLPASIAALFPGSFEESELGDIPSGWRNTSLGEVVEILDSRRIPLSSREREKRQGSYPYHGAASIMDRVDDFLFDGVYLLMGEDGSVIKDDGTPVLQYVWGKFWVNNHAHVLRGRNGVSTEHLFLHLKGCNIAPFVTGAVQPKLNQANMNRIGFVLPNGNICEIFAEVVETLFTGIRRNSEESETLSKLRDALLPKLISGEIRVSSAKAELAQAGI